MKRLVVASVVVLASLLVVAPVGAKPGQDKVAGTVTFPGDDVTTMNAQVTDFGTRGILSYSNGDLSWVAEGKVESLISKGTRPLPADPDRSNFVPAGTAFHVGILDSAARAQPDRPIHDLRGEPMVPLPGSECRSPVTGGQWHVHDGQVT